MLILFLSPKAKCVLCEHCGIMTCFCQSLTVLSLDFSLFELNLTYFNVLFTVTFFIVPQTVPPEKKRSVTLFS